MNLRDLQYLVALADHGHFGRAAEASHVSQPTLSTQLKKLEQHLGVELAERSAHGAVLTAAGREIVRSARAILLEVDDIHAIARRAADPETATLRLGVDPGADLVCCRKRCVRLAVLHELHRAHQTQPTNLGHLRVIAERGAETREQLRALCGGTRH